MTPHHFKKKCSLLISALILLVLSSSQALAWSQHPLITFPVVDSMPAVRDALPVQVESLESFLTAVEEKLEPVLASEEEWQKANNPSYAPLPPALSFKAKDGQTDVVTRFCRAIRINPTSKFPLYLQLAPGATSGGRNVVGTETLSFLKDRSDWDGILFVELKPEEPAHPVDIVSSASDEPDFLGLDIGLFDDNGSDFGKTYGFGPQPFGNPNLEYGSQAPFHMGFYHEPKIMFALAGFLKKTYPEYRIRMYLKLAQLAFQTGHPYWGWRFTGWGLHYLADLTQPYHATVLPGVSTAYAIWINTIGMIGIHGPKDRAIQLVSNRHTAIEKFAQVIVRKALLENDRNHPVLRALEKANSVPDYPDDAPRNIVSRISYDKAGELDEALEECMPDQFVSDPTFELGTSAERDKILERILAEKGQKAIDRLTAESVKLLVPFSSFGRAYIDKAVNGL